MQKNRTVSSFSALRISMKILCISCYLRLTVKSSRCMWIEYEIVILFYKNNNKNWAIASYTPQFEPAPVLFRMIILPFLWLIDNLFWKKIYISEHIFWNLWNGF